MVTTLRNLLTLIIILQASVAIASVKPNSLFSDHMVLQRGVAVPVWGTAGEGEEVTVQFNGQKVSARAKDGKWMVKLNPLKEGGPYTMTISGENIVTVNDILVGEVWVCSGQSNMERQLGPRQGQKPIINWESERDAANYPQIREYHVARGYSQVPVADAGAKWVVCSPATVSDFSAVGYFFARNLHKRLNVPVGVVFTAVGGTPAEHWTSRAVLESNPELAVLIEEYNKKVAEFPEKLEQYKREEAGMLAKFKQDSLQAVQAGKPVPKKPGKPADPAVSGFISGLYNKMITPIVPYAIKGFTWYQGETNNGRAKQYQTLLPVMISNWRTDWNNKDLPFLIVQIAPHKNMTPELREAQLLTVKKTPNTALIVTTDCGDSGDIHPADKKPVGDRLSLAANAIAYKEKLEYSGPMYESVKIKDGKATLTFSHIGRGLRAKGGDLKGFTIAGADKQFVPAQAVINGDKVIVSALGIIAPLAVRYGWANVPDGNLYNADGLPASPFRTDVE